MDERFQEGLFHGPGMQPRACFTILFLRGAKDASASEVGKSFAALWSRYQGLKAGRLPDLEPESVPAGNLTILVGYGLRSFKLPGARQEPVELGRRAQFLSPRPSGGGPLLAASGLHYESDVVINRATEDIAVQFIADTQLAVNRAVVETWKFLHDQGDDSPLMLAGFYSGFSREDGRSWIDFHDGLSNMKSSERASAMAIKTVHSEADAWTKGGTYMAFIRLGVDLPAWRRLDVNQQELLVGRAKHSGCPFQSVDADGRGAPVRGCDADPTNADFREPPEGVGDPTLVLSHVQRANHHRRNPERDDSLRIYRQGYEFLEPLETAPGFRAGLNFVSFQDTPRRLTRMLTQAGWLGSTNFGGEAGSHAGLLRVRAAGIFLVPPVNPQETFPGESIFSPP
jgi:deferrochelatase/peroxidase EfeB